MTVKWMDVEIGIRNDWDTSKDFSMKVS